MPQISYENKEGKLRKNIDFSLEEVQEMKDTKAVLEKEKASLLLDRAEAVEKAEKRNDELIIDLDTQIAEIDSELTKAEEVGVIEPKNEEVTP